MDQSSDLLKILDGSNLFRDSEFTSPAGRTQSGKEIFQVRAQREFPGQKPSAAAAQAVPAVAMPQTQNFGAPPPGMAPGISPGLLPGSPVIPNTPPPGGGSLTGGVR
jgi:hypothetical protein